MLPELIEFERLKEDDDNDDGSVLKDWLAEDGEDSCDELFDSDCSVEKTLSLEMDSSRADDMFCAAAALQALVDKSMTKNNRKQIFRFMIIASLS